MKPSNGVKAKLQYRLHLLAQDCKLVQQCLEDGVQYHNLDLLEKHLAKYRELCAQVK